MISFLVQNSFFDACKMLDVHSMFCLNIEIDKYAINAVNFGNFNFSMMLIWRFMIMRIYDFSSTFVERRN